MAELFEAVVSLPTLLLVLLVFGFAPGFVLRLLVLAYPRTDPRRRELIAELYTVPRLQRPLWVAEQLEVALFEGLAHRASATIRSFTRQRRVPAQTDKLEVRHGRILRAAVVTTVVGIVSQIVDWGLTRGGIGWGSGVGWAGFGVMVVSDVILAFLLWRIKRQRLNTRARRHFRP